MARSTIAGQHGGVRISPQPIPTLPKVDPKVPQSEPATVPVGYVRCVALKDFCGAKSNGYATSDMVHRGWPVVLTLEKAHDLEKRGLVRIAAQTTMTGPSEAKG